MTSDIQPLVSIIVPAFNVKDYISKCVVSIAQQMYENLDIILVDDGSTDGTDRILDRLALSDERIRVFRQANGGVSSARNAGLGVAKGKFVMFVDSDDWIDEGMVGSLMAAMEGRDIDMVTCGRRRSFTNADNRTVADDYHNLNTVLFGADIHIELIKELFHSGGGVVCRLIKRSCIESMEFRDGMRISEDQEWLLRVAGRLNSSLYISDALYNVRIRPGSATTKSRRTDIDDIEVVNQQIESWCRENGMDGDINVANALFFRSRLQYALSLRVEDDAHLSRTLRLKMKHFYGKTAQLPSVDKFKYYVCLMPPYIHSIAGGVYRVTRSLRLRVRAK